VKPVSEAEERDKVQKYVRDRMTPAGRLAGFFSGLQPVGLARAPGRLDVMGGIADYSGSLVLELPLQEAAFVFAQFHSEPVVRVLSLSIEESTPAREASFPSSAILGEDGRRGRTIRDGYATRVRTFVMIEGFLRRIST